jgi:predicted ATPase
MLTRLKVQGFKNLRDVDLRFGFFTCIAGQNGIGKSNLFDAIQFISNLVSMPILNAATLVRGIPGKYAVLSDLFGPPSGDDETSRIRFLVEAVVPRFVKDDYGQDVQVRCTCMEYELVLKLILGTSDQTSGDRIEIESERLSPRKLASVKGAWLFDGHEKVEAFVEGQKTNALIETLSDDTGIPRIWLRSDLTDKDKRAGAPTRVPLTTPRTVLSSVDSAVHASHLGMKRELESWRLLQLEPSALREPDPYNSESQITERGGHLPSALRRIGLSGDVALDVSELIRGVSSVEVIDNDVLQLRTLAVKIRGKRFPASALSDGTLRFLALSILACDPDATGLMCMEEPENGIHPTKISEMIRLVRRLADYQFDEDEIVDLQNNGLRQVIINTHSPLVIQEVAPGDLLFASAVTSSQGSSVEFLPILNTWRHDPSNRYVPPGDVRRFIEGQFAIPSSESKRKRDSLLTAAGLQANLGL